MLPVGNPAIGEDFIDREKEIAQILEALKKDSVLLIAPRRFGKTSVMRRVIEELSNRNDISVFLEVEDVYSPSRFLSEIVMALVENEKISKKTKLMAVLKNSFQWLKDSIEEIETPVGRAKLRSGIETDLKDDWMGKSRQIFEIINEIESNIYFIIDEFPVALKNMEPKEAERFLHWFRKLRQVSKNLRFIVGGSVSIDNVVRSAGGVNVINDFKRIKRGGFEKYLALEVIAKVFREEGWEYEAAIGEKILGCIGEAYIPYFIAVMLSAIKEEKVSRGGEINEELIEKVYNHRILGNEGKYYFEHYSQRLRIFYQSMEEKAAKAILKKVCSVEYYPVSLAFGIFKNETQIDDHEKFMDLIADLSNDFYIEHDPEKGLKFYSKMLRDWWRVYYGDSE
ncbi:ATPase domain predominantly from Archaea [uncultured archaeon]|nr:ATPase domain predominantly from Archaea [uncultured archaeon]